MASIDRIILALAALFGMLAVAMGAYGAHGAATGGDARTAELIATGSIYQMWHALAVIGCLALRIESRLPPVAFLLGAALFSGSLYALALGAPRALASVTPFGGGLFLLGWAALIYAALSSRKRPL